MVSVKQLKDIELFKGLTPDELQSIRQLTAEENYGSRQKVFEEGDPALKLYMLVEGEVEIKKWVDNKSKQVVVDTVTPGKIFGWSSLTEPRTLTASAWSTKPTRFIIFSNGKLRKLFEKNTRIGYVVMLNLAQVISQRLRHTSEHLLKQSLKTKEPVEAGQTNIPRA